MDKEIAIVGGSLLGLMDEDNMPDIKIPEPQPLKEVPMEKYVSGKGDENLRRIIREELRNVITDIYYAKYGEYSEKGKTYDIALRTVAKKREKENLK